MPRTTARRKYAASVQFRCNDTDTVDTLSAQVVYDTPQVCRAVFCVGLYCGDAQGVATKYQRGATLFNCSVQGQ
jgi:hypothetical protein